MYLHISWLHRSSFESGWKPTSFNNSFILHACKTGLHRQHQNLSPTHVIACLP
jgi:hypothetical protein